jgi:hypothetical protein
MRSFAGRLGVHKNGPPENSSADQVDEVALLDDSLVGQFLFREIFIIFLV